MHVMSLSTLGILAEAQNAMGRGDRSAARALVDRYAAEAASGFETADPEGLLMIVAPAAIVYERFGEWELAALKWRDVCALAEKVSPDTGATAGDYEGLARALTALNDYDGAIAALESSARHLRGAGEGEKRRAALERELARLRGLRTGAASGPARPDKG